MATGVGSSSRAAPANGASFGGVLGQAMAGPTQPAPGVTDGKADGRSDGKDKAKDTANSAAASGTTATLVADLTSTTGSGPVTSAAASVSGSSAVATVNDATGRAGKKRPIEAATTNSASSAQAAAAVVASLVAPEANGAANTKVAGAANAAPGVRGAAGLLATKSAVAPVNTANVRTNQDLVGPEDGTGSQEPDGRDPAQATVSRPAALASASIATALPPGAARSSAAPASGSVNAPASGSLDQQPIAAATGAAPAAGTPASTFVLAALTTAERDPNRAPSSDNGGATPVGVTGAGSLNASPGAIVVSVPLSSALGSQTAPTAANGAVSVLASDGSSQPLGSALGSQILSMVASGRNQVTVHLSPPDLGSLTVHVEVQSRDVSAWFASPQPQVQQAVSDALAQLHGSLSGAGLNLSGAWVGADVSGGGNGRPAATPLPVRRAAAVPGRVEASTGGTTSVEGLSVYA
ncbi:MAG TPA: flagellar hook-length control protein FliK [Stellaceae bacterium]|nr:flagellar hook-length control protein FliK [Stellaceae bacterium]